MAEGSSSACPLLELPPDVLENIIFKLDANGLYALKRTSKKTRDKLKPLLSLNKGQSIFEDACRLHLEGRSNSVVKNIITSFQTKLDEKIRNSMMEEVNRCRISQKMIEPYSQSWQIYQPSTIMTPVVNWEEVFEWHKKYLGKVSHLPMMLECMIDMEKILKEQFDIFYGLYWGDTVQDVEKVWPMQFISTCGSTLYHFMGPNRNASNPECITFYENMKESRRVGLSRMLPTEKVQSCKTVTFHFEGESNDVMTRPVLILQLEESAGLWLCPVQHGNALNIPGNFNPAAFPTYKRNSTPYAVCGDFIAIFENPQRISVYKLSETLGNLGAVLYWAYNSQGLVAIWNQISLCKNTYFFGLNLETSFPSFVGRRPIQRNPRPRSFFFQFMFIDMLMMYNGQQVWEKRPRILGNYKRLDKNIAKIEYDYDTLLVWTNEAFACPYGFSVLVFSTWNEQSFNIGKVSLVEIIDNQTIMLSTNRGLLHSSEDASIILAKITFEFDRLKGVYGDVGVKLKIIRIIDLSYVQISRNEPCSRVTRFHFDFDRGRPYIFLLTEREDLGTFASSFSNTPVPPADRMPPSTNISLTYKLMKITFRDLEDELSNTSTTVITNDLEPDPIVPCAPSGATFPEDMLARLMDSLQEL